MNKILILILMCAPGFALAQSTPPITVTEVDNSPRVTGVTKIIVSNGTLLVTGKTATITTGGGGGGGITIGTTTVTSGTAGRLLYETSGNVVGEVAGSSATANGTLALVGSDVSGGSTLLSLTPGAHTAVTAEVNDFRIPAHTMTITGAIATQRFARFGIPTISAASALGVTMACTVCIEGAPASGPNVTVTNSDALGIQSGTFRMADLLGNAFTLGAAPDAAVTDTVEIRGAAGNLKLGLFNNTSTGGAFFTVHDPAGVGNRIFFGFFDSATDSHSPTTIYEIGDYHFKYGVYPGTNAFVATATGLIGINKSSSIGAQLHAVSASSSRVGLRVDSAASPSVAIADFTDNGTSKLSIGNDGTLQQAGVTFANLPGSPLNGMLTFCSNCTIANPCASGGTGAFAKRLNSVWVCN